MILFPVTNRKTRPASKTGKTRKQESEDGRHGRNHSESERDDLPLLHDQNPKSRRRAARSQRGEGPLNAGKVKAHVEDHMTSVQDLTSVITQLGYTVDKVRVKES